MPQKKSDQFVYFLTIGIIRLLWRHSKAGLLLFVLPTWCYLVSQLAILIGLTVSDDFAVALALYCFGGLCLLLMVGWMLLGLRITQGFCRAVALIQIAWAILFSLVATYRTIRFSGFPLDPESTECIVSVSVMFILFIVTVLADLVRAFDMQRFSE